MAHSATRIEPTFPLCTLAHATASCACADERAEGAHARHRLEHRRATLTIALWCAQEQMCLLLREALTVGKIALSEHFFSIEMTKLEARSRISDELSSYCVVTESPKTTFGKVRGIYNRSLAKRFHQQGSVWLQKGRVLTTEFACGWQVRKTYTGKLYGKQDDLCVAVQLAVIGQSKFFQDPKHRCAG